MKFLVQAVAVMSVCSVVYAGEVLDKIVAVVDEQIITGIELDRNFAPLKKQYEASYKGDELRIKLAEGRRHVLEQLIDVLMVCKDAKDKGITIKNTEVDDTVNGLRVKFPSVEKFKETLRKQGITEIGLRESIERQLLVSRYKQDVVLSGVEVFSSDIKAYYDANRSKFMSSEEVQASQIFIPVEGSTTAVARATADEVYKALKDGADFKEMSKKYSKGPNANEGGDLGFLKNGQMVKEVEDALMVMDIGDISPVVSSASGFHILKLTARKQPRQLTLSEVEDKIRSMLYAQKAEERYRKMLADLRKKTYIEYKIDLE